MQIESEDQSTQSFQFIPQEVQLDRTFKEYLNKWGLQSLKVYSYIFDLKFDPLNVKQFLLDLFNSDIVRQFEYLPQKKDYYSTVDFTKLTCTTSMEVFDKLEQSGIVVNGYIKQQLEELYEEISIADHLRSAILLEDQEYYCTFNENDRNQLLFKLFSILVLGGQLCQYEDQVQAYLDQTKYLYKTLVNARKHPDTQQIYVDTYAFQILKLNKQSCTEHPQNTILVIVNPSLKQVHLVGNAWVKVW